MREIKFRAWDTMRKCFINNSEFGGMINPTDGGNKTTQLRYVDKVKLMQFTGLLDKSGKEIYEGDIVRYEDVEGDGNIESSIGKVYWNTNDAMWKVDESDLNEPLYETEWEIIGNIYENPELIK